MLIEQRTGEFHYPTPADIQRYVRKGRRLRAAYLARSVKRSAVHLRTATVAIFRHLSDLLHRRSTARAMRLSTSLK